MAHRTLSGPSVTVRIDVIGPPGASLADRDASSGDDSNPATTRSLMFLFTS
ncbi:hypothetical protein [Streptomyces sp. NPDC088739]|uniref:hypothetical protein n=1 Tax=Streptomyces sp. NPDC088739 TaxID=3365882 RepID=UPI0037FF741D